MIHGDPLRKSKIGQNEKRRGIFCLDTAKRGKKYPQSNSHESKPKMDNERDMSGGVRWFLEEL